MANLVAAQNFNMGNIMTLDGSELNLKLSQSSDVQFAYNCKQIADNIASAVEQALSLTRLESEAHKTIGQLSKGYKQRVGLAAALIHNPEVLILDEPTSGLDPNQLAEIRTLIKQQGQTKTVLFSTHILQEVEAICDRVIIINKGTIVADSPLAKLAETVSLPRRNMKLEEIFRYLTGES